MIDFLSNLHKETPQERKSRRHQEDIDPFPEKHYPQKEVISRDESRKLCPYCAPNWQSKYIYDAINDCYRKVQ